MWTIADEFDAVGPCAIAKFVEPDNRPSMYMSLPYHVASTVPPDAPIAKVAPAGCQALDAVLTDYSAAVEHERIGDVVSVRSTSGCEPDSGSRINRDRTGPERSGVFLAIALPSSR